MKKLLLMTVAVVLIGGSLAACETDAAEIESVIEIGNSVLGVISVAALCCSPPDDDGEG